jgi:hypothetical protein
MFLKVTSTICFLVVFLLSACDNPLTPSDLILSATPDPAFAESSSGVSYTIEGEDEELDETFQYPWKTFFSVTIAESAGVGLDITYTDVTVQQASGGIVTPPPAGETEHHQFNLQASGNRVDANSSATLNFEVWFDLPNGGRDALAKVSVSYRDDNDYTGTETIEVQIQ